MLHVLLSQNLFISFILKSYRNIQYCNTATFSIQFINVLKLIIFNFVGQLKWEPY